MSDPHKYPPVVLVLKDSNGADVLNMKMSEPEALWELTDFFRSQLSVGFCGSIYFERPDEDEDDDGTTCDKCDKSYTSKDIDGGRCLSCGTMICAEWACEVCEHPESAVGPLRKFAGYDRVCEECVCTIESGRLK